MADEPASKRQRVGAEGECTMTLQVSGSITLEGQSVGELLLDLKGRVLELEERAKNAEDRAERAEALASKLSDDMKADKTAVADRVGLMEAELKELKETCAHRAEAVASKLSDDLKADETAAADRFGIIEMEIKGLKATLVEQAELELEKQRIAELERQVLEMRAAEFEQQKAAELEKQKAAELEKQKVAELEQQKAAELEKQKAAELEQQKVAELEKQKAAELEKQKAAELGKQRAAELEKQKAAELEKQRVAELEKQRAAELEKQKAAELEKQKAAPPAMLQRRNSTLDAGLAEKSGKEFLEAQVANLSDTAKQTLKEIDVALKEEIEFTSSSSELTPKGKKIVNKVFEVLKKAPSMVIRVEGHTGCRCIAGGGQPKRGQKCKAVELSDERAASVIDHLRSLGCQNELKSRGHGCVFRVGMSVKVFPAAGQ